MKELTIVQIPAACLKCGMTLPSALLAPCRRRSVSTTIAITQFSSIPKAGHRAPIVEFVFAGGPVALVVPRTQSVYRLVRSRRLRL
ncbi:hypothetical protein pRL100233 (plasmid) [Rhizobium johnstonii 3841]|uniref:Uncharacterized protein n=1 Tax=Rhizobium johnstonii (strain DSM 114642 / LMG 32736 / 3841) TaxID=216596 RepID=Q1M7R9_RHIJ3|nr:hypothetical protein pRL100233 [Rhizobium johnstonii 3841]